MKNILYIVYAYLFKIYSVLRINKKKTTFIGTHDMSINGNIMAMYKKIMEQKSDSICKFITKDDIYNENIVLKIFYSIRFLFVTSFNLATSKYIFLDNTFLPMAYIKFKPEVKVVQLWHGCNTIKKFGQLSNTGKLKELENKISEKYTHVIVSSFKVIDLHQQAFGIKREKIFPLGLPNLDIFFNNKKIEEEKKIFFEQYPNLKNKKIIMYAPTFRDNVDEFDENMNLQEVVDNLSQDYVIINRFHPHVARNYRKIEGNNVIDMSHYEDLTRLLIITDILISDYSSIVFDYALLKKPIIFYAYDKYEYENNIRGFYCDYNKIAIKYAKNKKELIAFIKDIEDNGILLNIDEWIDYKDSNSTQRIYEKIYSKA